jgi:hypothetical protein
VVGSEFRDPEKNHPGSRILGVKMHWIPDPEHWLADRRERKRKRVILIMILEFCVHGTFLSKGG